MEQINVDEGVKQESRDCRACKKQIAKTAKLCHHCGTFQSWHGFLLSKQAILAIFTLLVSSAALWISLFKSYMSPETAEFKFKFAHANEKYAYIYVTNLGKEPGVIESVNAQFGAYTGVFNWELLKGGESVVGDVAIVPGSTSYLMRLSNIAVDVDAGITIGTGEESEYYDNTFWPILDGFPGFESTKTEADEFSIGEICNVAVYFHRKVNDQINYPELAGIAKVNPIVERSELYGYLIDDNADPDLFYIPEDSDYEGIERFIENYDNVQLTHQCILHLGAELRINWSNSSGIRKMAHLPIQRNRDLHFFFRLPTELTEDESTYCSGLQYAMDHFEKFKKAL